MRRKVITLAMSLFLASAGSALAHEAHFSVTSKAKDTMSVVVNGVPVISKANHQNEEGSIYVSVQAFADLFGKTVEWGEGRKTASLNGTSFDIQMKNGEATAWVRDLAKAVGAQNISWDQVSKEAYILVLPEGTVQLSPEVVPAMGEHWANLQAGDMPTGPIYGVYKGELVFLEYMIDQKSFIEGKSIVNLGGMKGVPSPAVVQTDVEFQSKGHPGFEIPHYDIHMYFISDEQQQKIGISNVELTNTNGEKIGQAVLIGTPEGVALDLKVSGLTPGKHGLHIHQNAITNHDFKTAGGHFNPDNKKHGQDNPEGAHLGDLPNLEVKADGTGELKWLIKGASLEDGKPNSIIGKSIVIHAGEDDGKTDPAGNSGDRIAGGSITE